MSARVQFSWPQLGINETKAMLPPLKIGDLNAWFKAACKIHPGIPNHWYRDDELVTRDTIIFKMIDPKTHDRCAIVIARR
jgi:hypothetical protein